LLDDNPLPATGVSSSVLVATYSTWESSKNGIGGGKPPPAGELEKGLLTLICSDSAGLQVPFLLQLCSIFFGESILDDYAS